MNKYKVYDLLVNVISGEWGNELNGKEGVKVIRTTNFTNIGKLDLEKEVVTRDIDEKKIEQKKLQYGDIIIEKSGGSPDQPVGRVVFFDIKDDIYLCNNFTSILRPNNSIVYNKYLFYYLFYLHQMRRVLKFQNKTTGIINLKLDDYLKKTDIELPSIEDQERLVSLLERSSKLIDLRKSQILELSSLTQSVFLEMFGDPIVNKNNWNVKKLGELCTVVRGGSPRPINMYLGGTVPWIKIGDATLGDSIYLKSTKEKIIEEGIRKSRLVPSGSLIFANCGVSLGFARIITFDGCIHDGWLAFENITKNIDKIFLLKLLNFYTNYFRQTAPDGTQPNLNTSIMKEFGVIVPPIELQKKFVDILFEIEKQKTLIENSLKELQNNFQSLLQQGFKGILV
ncbi:restriction endonuclease subunit S [Niallia sp. Sow4_A1]|uniref:restriction endonuclease subunit S n=1 Tax=Niallia sp. Sow4_A1 TaxID=3438793 RepID=UPI003F9D5F8A